MAQITWYMREKLTKKPKMTEDSLKVYNELNNVDIDNDLLDGDSVNVNEIMDDLEQTSERIIDDVSTFNSNGNLQSPTLIELFNTQLIEIALVEELVS